MMDPEAEATITLAASINNKQMELEIDPSYAETISPNEIRIETALMVDGLHLLKQSLVSLPGTNKCSTEITCDDKKGWNHGSTAINYMKMVKFLFSSYHRCKMLA